VVKECFYSSGLTSNYPLFAINKEGEEHAGKEQVVLVAKKRK
jgi:hypothetical protein